MNINCGRGLVASNCGPSVALSATRGISVTATSLVFKGTPRAPRFNSKKGRKAHWTLNKEKFKEPIQAQKIRAPWDYPVMGDQRSSWKHKRWYDSYLNTWVDTTPKPPKKDFNLHYKRQREALHDADNIREHFSLLLDRFYDKKFEVSTFDQEFPQLNMSYYYQYLTNSKYVHDVLYTIYHTKVDPQYMDKFRQFVTDSLLQRHHHQQIATETNPYKKKRLADEQLTSDIMTYLTVTTPQHKDSQLSYNNENSMFWLRGRGFQRYTRPDDTGVAFQCHDNPYVQLRTTQSLAAFSPFDGPMSTSGDVPHVTALPYAFGKSLKNYRNTISTGYKLYAGDIDPNYQEALDEGQLTELPPPIHNHVRYGHTQLVVLPQTYSRDWYNENLEHCDITGEIEEHLKAHGIMSGWVWTASQAHYDQYYMDNDVTKPYCSQVIISDGQHLSFFSYQLNTVAIDDDNIATNTRRNVCYGKTSIKLYDDVTEDEVINLNDEALEMLVKFVRNGSDDVAISDDVINAYDATLNVQYSIAESCELEDERPLHKVVAEEAAEEAKQLALVQQEETRNVELQEKYGNLASKVIKPIDDVTKEIRKALKSK